MWVSATCVSHPSEIAQVLANLLVVASISESKVWAVREHRGFEATHVYACMYTALDVDFRNGNYLFIKFGCCPGICNFCLNRCLPTENLETTNARTCRVCALARAGIGTYKKKRNQLMLVYRECRENWNPNQFVHKIKFLNCRKNSSMTQARKEGKEGVGTWLNSLVLLSG